MQDRCSCFIVPKAVLELLSQDLSLPEETRKALADTGATEATWRKLRTANVEATKAKMAIRGIGAALATSPVVTVFDCHHTTSLPGTPVANPAGSTDITARRTFDTTTQVAATSANQLHQPKQWCAIVPNFPPTR